MSIAHFTVENREDIELLITAVTGYLEHHERRVQDAERAGMTDIVAAAEVTHSRQLLDQLIEAQEHLPS